MGLDRRDFLLTGGGMAAGLAAGDLASPRLASAQAQPPVEWQREADVVVIGSGAVGLPASNLIFLLRSHPILYTLSQWPVPSSGPWGRH